MEVSNEKFNTTKSEDDPTSQEQIPHFTFISKYPFHYDSHFRFGNEMGKDHNKFNNKIVVFFKKRIKKGKMGVSVMPKTNSKKIIRESYILVF